MQIKVGENYIRIINGYGSQEDDNQQNIFNFWVEIENVALIARENDCLTVIQMDAKKAIPKKLIESN